MAEPERYDAVVLGSGSRTTRGRLVPFCIFTDPSPARVGLSEGEARRTGVAVRVATLPIGAVLRTRTIAPTRGYMKALVGASDDRILGFTMIGPRGRRGDGRGAGGDAATSPMSTEGVWAGGARDA
jgi:pyruvate/2-oxoglutarate dehydrogenase complex dihydrolipoamide dehydrogenase (E3) component